MARTLDRDDLIDGLREVVKRARTLNITGVSIRIVGGAALRLAHFDRATTADIDAHIEPLDPIVPIIRAIAEERGWPRDWLNGQAAQFIPHWGQQIEWKSLLDDDSVSISVAPVDALLAMKLAATRPGRDTDDIVKLLRLNHVTNVTAAEELYESFYPGDGLADRTIALLERIFEVGLPPAAPSPPRAELD